MSPTLSLIDLAAASALALAAGLLSVGFRLGLERQLATSLALAIVQLLAAGWLMKVAIEHSSSKLVLLLAAVMVLAAGWHAMLGSRSSPRSWHGFWLLTSALLATGSTVTLFLLVAVLGREGIADARTTLAILGLVLGNALVGASTVGDQLIESARVGRPAIDARLALGASRMAALEGPLRNALRSGLAPVIGAVTAAGTVLMPGLMAGQVLAGADPFEAAKLQIAMLFAFVGASAFANVLVAAGVSLVLTDGRHRLRLDRLA
jgi:putative ABC transport system permease protein